MIDKNYILENSTCFPFNKNEGDKDSKPIFIYFLIDKKDIVYVGKTVDPVSRLKQHSSLYGGKKKFDRTYIFQCDPSKVDKLENKYILKFNPKYNVKINSKDLITVSSLMARFFNDQKEEIINFLKENDIDIHDYKGKKYINRDVILKDIMLSNKKSA